MLENQKKALNLQRVFHSIRFKEEGCSGIPFFIYIGNMCLPGVLYVPP